MLHQQSSIKRIWIVKLTQISTKTCPLRISIKDMHPVPNLKEHIDLTPPPPAGPFVYNAVNSLANWLACSFCSKSPSMRNLTSSLETCDEVFPLLLAALRLSN